MKKHSPKLIEKRFKSIQLWTIISTSITVIVTVKLGMNGISILNLIAIGILAGWTWTRGEKLAVMIAKKNTYPMYENPKQLLEEFLDWLNAINVKVDPEVNKKISNRKVYRWDDWFRWAVRNAYSAKGKPYELFTEVDTLAHKITPDLIANAELLREDTNEALEGYTENLLRNIVYVKRLKHEK